MECPECGHDEYMQKNGSDVWWCENCGWDEQEEIDFPLKNRIFVSEVVAQELADDPSFVFKPLGYFEFKGVSGLHRLYKLTEVH